MKNPFWLFRLLLGIVRWVSKRSGSDNRVKISPHSLLKKKVLKALEASPKSVHTLEIYVREEGFRTGGVTRVLKELIEDGEVRIKARMLGKPWLFERVRRTIDV